MSHLDRIVILIDMDCFYCQVEEKLDPKLEGKPIAVVQYNQWRGGGIIAVNYPARDRGVTRHMRGEEAQKKCPEIVLAKVPQVRGKADLSKYREAGKRVADVLQTFTPLLERASVDEAYLDVTDIVSTRMKEGVGQISIDRLQNTHIVGCDIKDFLHNLQNHTEFSENNFKLCLGGIIAEEIRAEVYKQTGYRCSAGIAHNKVLAKLVCGLNKPNKQTIIPHDAVPTFFKDLPVVKVRSLGGKFGTEVSENLGITTMCDLALFSEKQLVEKFGKKNGSWLYYIARGIDSEPVVTRLISKSIGCCKRFPGRTALLTHDSVQHWISELAIEISERLEKDFEDNNRKAKQMIVSFAQEINKKNLSNSRTCPLNSYQQSQIAQDATEVVRKCCQKSDGSYVVTFLGISVSNFQELKKTVSIASFFQKNTDLSAINSSTISQNSKVLLKSEEKPLEVNCQTEHSVDKDGSSDMPINTTNNENDDPENCSIYSANTEDLEEDPKSFIYFEDIYPEFVSSQPLECYQNINEINLKISNNEECSKDLDVRRKSSRSFFTKYFDSVIPKLDKNHIDVEVEESNIVDNSIKQVVYSNNAEINPTPVITNRKTNEFGNKETTDTKRKSSEVNILQFFPKYEDPNENYCSECKKNIPIEEIIFHNDYHVAKNLQTQEKAATKKIPRTESFFCNYINNLENNENPISEFKENKKLNGIKDFEKKRKSDEWQHIDNSNHTKKKSEYNILNFFSKHKGPDASVDEKVIPEKPQACGYFSQIDNPSTSTQGSNHIEIQSSEDNILLTSENYCSDCKKHIPIQERLSHSDYHMAKQLQVELNKSVVSNATTNKNINTKPKSKVSNMDISIFFKPV